MSPPHRRREAQTVRAEPDRILQDHALLVVVQQPGERVGVALVVRRDAVGDAHVESRTAERTDLDDLLEARRIDVGELVVERLGQARQRGRRRPPDTVVGPGEQLPRLQMGEIDRIFGGCQSLGDEQLERRRLEQLAIAEHRADVGRHRHPVADADIFQEQLEQRAARRRQHDVHRRRVGRPQTAGETSDDLLRPRIGEVDVVDHEHDRTTVDRGELVDRLDHGVAAQRVQPAVRTVRPAGSELAALLGREPVEQRATEVLALKAADDQIGDRARHIADVGEQPVEPVVHGGVVHADESIA